MDFIADVLLISGALAAALYCIVLSRRLKRFNDLEKGVGGAIAVLSAQVDDMTKTLDLAQDSAKGSNESLEGLTTRAEQVAKRLELLVASMHDLPTDASVSAMNDIRTKSETDVENESKTNFRSARADTTRTAA